MTRRSRRSLRAVLSACVAFVLAGCASAPPPQPLSQADMKQVVGQWSGIADYVAPGSNTQRHFFTFTADGTFSEVMGAWSSAGTFKIANDKILYEGQNSKGVLALYDSGNGRILSGEGEVLSGAWRNYTGSGGGHYKLELRPNQ